MQAAIRNVWSFIVLMSMVPAVVVAADPADAAVPVADQEYHSPLANYQRWEYQAPGDWRAANDRVAEIGGWQAYAAEVWEASQQADAADDEPDTADHHGHHH